MGLGTLREGKLVSNAQQDCPSSCIILFCRLNVLGYRIGTRALELMTWRVEAQTKAPKREIRFLPALMSIHTQVWRSVFGRPADAIEKSVENADECA